MKIENLKKGMVIKNYKELCDILNEKIKTGQARQVQLKKFKQCFSYHKEKYKFIIDEILVTDLVQIENIMKSKRGTSENSRCNNRTKYIDDIEILLLDMIFKRKEIELTRNQLLKELYIVNKNFTDCQKYILNGKLSKYLDMDFNHLQEFYEVSKNTFKRNLDTALNNICKNKYVKLKKLIYIKKINATVIKNKFNQQKVIKKVKVDKFDNEICTYNIESQVETEYRKATKKEKKLIIRAESEAKERLHCENEQEIVRKGCWNEYSNIKQDILMSTANIEFYYTVYKITFDQDQEYDYMFLNSFDTRDKLLKLNKDVMDRLSENAIKRHEKSCNKKVNYRKDTTYIHNHTQFLDTFIKIKYDSKSIDLIEEDVKKIMIGENDLKKYKILNY